LLQGNALIQPNPAAQSVTRFDKFSGQVYTGDLAPIAAGDKARCAAKAASNVENMHLGREAELIEELLGCLAPANMKLVNGSKIVNCDCIWHFAKCDNAGTYSLN
jgi:hypothetical protein